MAQWYQNLYVGKKASRYAEKIRRRVNKGRYMNDLYLITACENGYDQLEILDGACLMQPEVVERLPLIIGIALGKKEAIGLVAEIADTAYRVDEKKDIREYLGI